MKKMRNLKWSLQSLLTIILFTQAGCNGGGSSGSPTQSGGASNTSTGRVNVISLPANYGNRGVASDRKYISGRKKSQADIMKSWVSHRYDKKISNLASKSTGISVPIYGINTSINAPADNSCFSGQLTVNPNDMKSQISNQTLASIISNTSQTTLGVGLDSNLMLLDPALSVTNLDLVLASDSQTHLTSSQTVFQFSQTAKLEFNNFAPSNVPETTNGSQLGQLCGSKVITQTTGYFNAYVEIVASTDNSNYSSSIAFNNSNSDMETIFGTYSNLVQSSSQNVSFSVNVYTQGGTPQDIAAINNAALEVAGQQCLQGISVSCSQWSADISSAISLAGQDAIKEAQQGNLDYLEVSTASPIAQFQNAATAVATSEFQNVIDPYTSAIGALQQMGGMSLQLSLLQTKASNLNNLVQQNGLGNQLGNATMLQQLQQGYGTASAYVNNMMENCLNNPQAVCDGIESTLNELFTDVSNQNPNTVPLSIIPYLVANFSALQMSGTYNDSYGSSYSYSKDVTPIEPSSSDSLNLLYYNCASEWDYATGNVSAGTIVSCINNGYNTAGILSVAGTSPIAVQPLVINNNGTPAVTVFNINPYYSNSTNSILSNGVGYIFYVNNLDSFGSTPTGSYFDNGVIYNGYVNFPAWGIDNGYFSYIQDPLSVNLYPNGYPLSNSNTGCQFSTDTSCTITLTVPNTNVQTQDSILLQYSPNWPSYSYPMQ
jgi:hypothetical protein